MGTMNKVQRTYQSRTSTSETEDKALSAYAALFSQAERSLFAGLHARGDLADLKREFLPKFGMTARQFNAMAAELKGKISSIKERRTGLIKEAQQRIARAGKVLKKITAPVKRHQKKRRLATLQDRLNKLRTDHDSGVVPIYVSGRESCSVLSFILTVTDTPLMRNGGSSGGLPGVISSSS
jgi:hypothetical protein